jgi:DNA-binding transcriptional ArsR family regulator
MRNVKDDSDEAARLLKAMAHPARLRLLRRLRDEECCVSEVEKCLRISQPNVSQHLRILREAGLIEGTRRRTRVCYRIADARVRAVLDIIAKGTD